MLFSRFIVLTFLFDFAKPTAHNTPQSSPSERLRLRSNSAHAQRDVSSPQHQSPAVPHQLKWRRQAANSTDPADNKRVQTLNVEETPGTENPDPEDPENPDPEDPENPDPEDPENPDPEDPENPDPEDPENPDPEDPENPDPEDPENPDPEDPENPDPEDPENPDPEDPENPDPEDPENPDPEDPENPDPEDPENPDPEDPEGEDPEGEDPEEEDPEGEDPEEEDPEGEDPEEEDPEEEDPEEEDPEGEDPEGEDPNEGEDDPEDDGEGDDKPVLIGDLVHTIETPIAKDIAKILLGKGGNPESKDHSPNPHTAPTDCDPTDFCCPYFFISEELDAAFTESDGQCNDLARAAVRLGFHDAGTWSLALANAGQDYGGADGSLALFNEDTRPENGGLAPVTNVARELYAKYGVGMGDLIQYMSVHATVTCPLGPRIPAYVGRIDATQAAPDGLLPSVHAPADDLIALFEDKTISPHELTALMGAHSTSKQFGVDASRSGAPQDSTPGVWDVEYYNQTLDETETDCYMKFESDIKLAAHPRMSNEWQRFIGDQHHWNEDYARAYVRLSLLGVNNINNLTDCSKTLPLAKTSIPKEMEPDVCTIPTSSSSSLASSTTMVYNSTSSYEATPTSSIEYNTTSSWVPTNTSTYDTVSSTLYPTTTPSANTTSSLSSDVSSSTSNWEYNTTSSVYSETSTSTLTPTSNHSTSSYIESTSSVSDSSVPASTSSSTSSSLFYNSTSSVTSSTSATETSSSYDTDSTSSSSYSHSSLADTSTSSTYTYATDSSSTTTASGSTSLSISSSFSSSSSCSTSTSNSWSRTTSVPVSHSSDSYQSSSVSYPTSHTDDSYQSTLKPPSSVASTSKYSHSSSQHHGGGYETGGTPTSRRTSSTHGYASSNGHHSEYTHSPHGPPTYATGTAHPHTDSHHGHHSDKYPTKSTLTAHTSKSSQGYEHSPGPLYPASSSSALGYKPSSAAPYIQSHSEDAHHTEKHHGHHSEYPTPHHSPSSSQPSGHIAESQSISRQNSGYLTTLKSSLNTAILPTSAGPYPSAHSSVTASHTVATTGSPPPSSSVEDVPPAPSAPEEFTGSASVKALSIFAVAFSATCAVVALVL